MTTIFLYQFTNGGITPAEWIAEYGIFNTGIDISPSSYGFSSANPPVASFHICVYGLDAGATAKIDIVSSLNSFEASTWHASASFTGPIGATSNQGDTGQNEGLLKSTSHGYYPAGFPTNPQYFRFGPNDQAISTIPWGQESAILGISFPIFTPSDADIALAAWLTY
jgi:hypothetical protein